MVDQPFGDDIVEVVLPLPPLIRVVAQIRFPPVASVSNQAFMAPFQEALRRDYPILRQEREVSLVVGADGAVSQPTNGVIWRLHDKDEIWRLSLGTSFLSIETTGYTNHAEFVKRFVLALEALAALIHPVVYDRLGLRYINRFHGERLARLPKLVRPELLGFLAVDIGSNVEITGSILQTQFEVEGTSLVVRAMKLGKDATVDPGLIPAISEPSWILDFDAFSTKPRDFGIAEAVELLRRLAFRSYRLFRWSVRDDLIIECGGKP